MRHLWTLVVLIASTLAEYRTLYGGNLMVSNGGYISNSNTGIISGGQRGRPLENVENQAGYGFINGDIRGGPFGQGSNGLIGSSNGGGPFIISGSQGRGMPGDGLVNRESSGGSFGQRNTGLIRGSNSGGPFKVNVDQESIIYGGQSEEPIRSHPKDELVDGGGSGAPFGQEKTGLIRGRNSGGPFQENVGQEGILAGTQLGGSSGNHAHENAGSSGGSFGQGNIGLIRGSNTGGPFRVNADQESIISGVQNDGLFGNQARDKLVNGGSSGGPFGQGHVGLIRGINSGGPFQVNAGQEGITSGSHSGGPFGNTGNMVGDGLVNGHNTTGGPYGQAKDRLIRSSSGEGPARSNGGIISGSQNGGPFGNQAGYGLVNGGVNGGPFAKTEGGLIQGSSIGGPFKAIGEQAKVEIF